MYHHFFLISPSQAISFVHTCSRSQVIYRKGVSTKSLVRTGYPHGVIVYCYVRDSLRERRVGLCRFFLFYFDFSFERVMGRVEYVGR